MLNEAVCKNEFMHICKSFLQIISLRKSQIILIEV